MPLLKRFLVAGIPQHVVQRGIDRQAVFFDSSDYEHYLELVFASAESYQLSVHAYCLMTNHIHLLVTPHEKAALPRMMQRLGSNYVRFINQRYRRSGTLWDGRYRASLVESDDYFLTCQRYIELNPLRAKMVVSPDEYPWSSYHRNALGAEDRRVTPHEVYLELGGDESVRRAAYRSLFSGALGDEELSAIRSALEHNHVLGSERFRRQVEIMLAHKVGTGRVGRPRKAEPARKGDEEQGELPL